MAEELDVQHNFRSIEDWKEAREALDAVFQRIFDILKSNPTLHALVDDREGEPVHKAGDFVTDYRGGNISLKFSDGKNLVNISLGSLGGTLSADQHGAQPAEYDPGTGSFLLHPLATTADPGFLSATDKVKLNGLSIIDLSNATPDSVNTNAGVAGTSPDASRADHTHQVLVGTPTQIGTANAAGTSTNLVRADHVHAHGNMTGGSLHAVATTGTAGFMSATDKAKSDRYLGVTSAAVIPGSVNGEWGFWRDTSLSQTWIFVNIGGTVYKDQLL